MATQRCLDLNADLGEGIGDDAAILAVVSSANVACGGHTGDAASMAATCGLAAERGVTVGAHPSYCDREGFGRNPGNVGAATLRRQLADQIAALEAAAVHAGTRVAYVKAHGALYHAAAERADHAGALIDALTECSAAFGRPLPLLGATAGQIARLAAEAGIVTVSEAFCDRAYAADGTLVARTVPGSVLDDPDEVAGRAVRIACEREVTTIEGATIPLAARSLCVHGDTPGAAAMAAAVRAALERAGVAIVAFALAGGPA